MIEIETQDTKSAFNLASRAAKYVSSLEMVLLEESGNLEKLGEQIEKETIRREDYSPIFAAMNRAERRLYKELSVEILVASQTEMIFNDDKSDLSHTFMACIASTGLRMQELLTSVAVREKLLEEEDFVSLWAATSGHDQDAHLLEKYEAPVLACIAASAKPQP